MKKVKGICLLKKLPTNWELRIFNEPYIIQQCLEQWHKTEDAVSIELEFEIKSKFQFKTQSQLGYIHASLKPVIIGFVQSHGDERKVDEIWNDIKVAVDFTEEKKSCVDGKPYMDVKSLATSSKEEVSGFIDRLIRWAGEWGVRIETPEDYKRRLGIKELN